MRKLLFLLPALCLCLLSPAATPAGKPPGLNANEILLPIGNTGRTISLLALSQISVGDFETLAGKKLSFFHKIGFKASQKKLRNNINADGTIRDNFLQPLANKMAKENTGFHLGGFALGFLLSFYGIIIAYLIKDDKKKARVKWAWIGLGSLVVVIFIGTILFALANFK